MSIHAKSRMPQLTSVNGQWMIVVPWNQASSLYERLKKRGYASTLFADSLDQDARLELWPGVDPAKALAAIKN